MQDQSKLAAVIAVCAATVVAIDEPLPFVEIKDAEMAQYFYKFPVQSINIKESAKAITLYHQLRKSYGLSHKTMGEWLGVKRRSLYNWMSDPESAIKYGKQIEFRLDALSKLSEDMEPEHRGLLEKIAFSPIYGDSKFGDSIINGESSEQLITRYDKLYSQFESYRRTLKLKSNVV